MNKEEKKIRKEYKGRASFRVAPGSDNPYSTSVRRLIVGPTDEKTHWELRRIDLQEIFDVEVVTFT